MEISNLDGILNELKAAVEKEFKKILIINYFMSIRMELRHGQTCNKKKNKFSLNKGIMKF
jgi:hypothetical protein